MLIYTNKGLVRNVLTCWLFDVIWSSKGQYQGIFGGGCVKCRLETMQWGCFFKLWNGELEQLNRLLSMSIGLFRFGLKGYWCTGNLFCCVCVCVFQLPYISCSHLSRQVYLFVGISAIRTSWVSFFGRWKFWITLIWLRLNTRNYPTNHLSTWVDFPPFC